jgi:hypothetical protein
MCLAERVSHSQESGSARDKREGSQQAGVILHASEMPECTLEHSNGYVLALEGSKCEAAEIGNSHAAILGNNTSVYDGKWSRKEDLRDRELLRGCQGSTNVSSSEDGGEVRRSLGELHVDEPSTARGEEEGTAPRGFVSDTSSVSSLGGTSMGRTETTSGGDGDEPSPASISTASVSSLGRMETTSGGDVDEPLLADNPDRYTIYPIR